MPRALSYEAMELTYELGIPCYPPYYTTKEEGRLGPVPKAERKVYVIQSEASARL